jgi:hypothetical protein
MTARENAACRWRLRLPNRAAAGNLRYHRQGQKRPKPDLRARPHPDIQQRACGLELAAGNRINQEADPGLEDAARYALEQDFSFIPGLNPLQSVLLKRGCERPILLAVVDENHGWTEGRRDHIHARPQCQLGDKGAAHTGAPV